MKLDTFFHSILVSSLALLLCGCSVGPQMLQGVYLSYNERVRATADEELLLNIVRLRYHDTIEFLAVNSISAQASFDVSFGAEIGTNDYDATLIIPELQYSDRPTFSFSPQRGSEFAKRFVEPIEVGTLAYLASSDWPIKILMELMVKEVNGVVNASHGDIGSFYKITDTLGDLQKNHKLLIAFTQHHQPVSAPIEKNLIHASDLISAAKAGYSFIPEPDGLSLKLSQTKSQPIMLLRTTALEEQAILKQLRVTKTDDKPIQLRAGSKPRLHSSTYSDINLRTRSMLGAIVYLSHGVTAPQSHIDSNFTFSIWPIPVAANDKIDEIFNVKSSLARPEASLAVQYRGYWFYIDETDLTSRATFLVLSEIFRLALVGTDPSQIPLLTLPLGGQ